MPDQFSLPGFDPPPARPCQPGVSASRGERLPYTLFFAIYPDPAAAAAMAALGGRLGREHRLTGHRVATARLHVTLHDLGGHESLPGAVVDAAAGAANAVAASAAPSFEIVFDRALSFPGSGALVLRGGDGSAALAAFRRRLGVQMQRLGLPIAARFTPHLTLGYDRRVVAEREIEPVCWTAGSFALVLSHVGKGRHERLGEWPLAGRGA